MRSALIIGAGGQDGRLLASFLSDRGYTVHGWVRQDPIKPMSHEYTVINLSDAESVAMELRRQEPNDIYYLAAFHHSTEKSGGIDTIELLLRSFDVHVMGLLNVLHAMKAYCRQGRLFYAASSHVFGTSTAGRKNENSPLLPDSAYAISKTAGLRCCQLFRHRENVFAATGILFNHESPLRKPSFVSQKIVHGALRARRERAFRLMLGDIDACVDWGYAPDYVDAMYRILQLSEPGDFVVASDELHSVGEFAAIAFEEVGLDWRDYVEIDPRLLKRGSYPLRGNSKKLRNATGWSPSFNFRELVATLVHETERGYEII